MIIHRNGNFFVCQLSSGRNLVPIHEPDIILLSYFLDGCTAEKIARQFVNDSVVRSMLSNIQLEQVYQRIEFFLQKQIIVFCDDERSEVPIQKIDLAKNNQNADFSINDHVRLGTNFALIAGVDGFKIWSARTREFYLLGSEMLFLLTSFSMGKNIAAVLRNIMEVTKLTQLEASVDWLIQKGLLIKAEDKSVHSNVVQLHESKSESVGSSIGALSSKSWLDIEVDDRIPVYFVPHMQNHYPLALGMLFSAIDSDVDNLLRKKYLLIPITYLSPEDFINGPYKKFGRGVWLFSNYMWSLDTNLKISEIIKQHIQGNLTIHGGPSTPNYKTKSVEFFEQYKSVDICVHGEGEASITEILRCLYMTQSGKVSYELSTLQDVSGITFRAYGKSGSSLYRTKSRARLKKPDIVPSPYNKGYFEHYSSKQVEAAIIESNRGCPFGCTFCDWGSATNQKIRKFDLDRVKQEIRWVAKNRVRVLWIADANFGLYDRDIELSKFIVEMKIKYHFPQEIVVNYTKNTTWRLAEIIKIFSQGKIISQGVISIQTTDATTLEVINRKNIKTKKYDELSQIFKELKLPLSTDLMLGLPGITITAFKNDLQRYFDLDVSLKAYPTQLLPNSPMADPDYVKKYEIEVDEHDFLVSTFSYTKNELDEMKALYSIYTIADGYSLLRYVLRFLQWDHNIKAIDFLSCISDVIKKKSALYPRIIFAFNFFETDKFMPGGWKCFYEEIADLAKNKFGILRDTALDTVLTVNEFAMPDDSHRYPVSVTLQHNFEAYFLEYNDKKNEKKPAQLKLYSPSTLLFDDFNGMSNINSYHIQYDTHQFFWEIHSSIARAKSVSDIR